MATAPVGPASVLPNAAMRRRRSARLSSSGRRRRVTPTPLVDDDGHHGAARRAGHRRSSPPPSQFVGMGAHRACAGRPEAGLVGSDLRHPVGPDDAQRLAQGTRMTKRTALLVVTCTRPCGWTTRRLEASPAWRAGSARPWPSFAGWAARWGSCAARSPGAPGRAWARGGPGWPLGLTLARKRWLVARSGRRGGDKGRPDRPRPSPPRVWAGSGSNRGGPGWVLGFSRPAAYAAGRSCRPQASCHGPWRHPPCTRSGGAERRRGWSE